MIPILQTTMSDCFLKVALFLFMLLFLLRLGSIMRFVMNTLIAETLKTIPVDGMRKGKHYEKQNEAYSE